ncbi:hypothetical protein CTI12_AA212630 [Artemisia annua]|uniref:DUF8039 domain-containing protein n=1 Tax=Artemisia annua TaxID=35608 RepID=A0A2U1NYL2_ARTAN|nr:hypothetical protein CTI12_AA212630 [Artemisia annua]
MAIVKEKIAEARVELKAEYDKDLARAIKEMNSRQENENPESPPMRKSSCDSASNFDVLDNIQEASKCQLFLPYATKKVLCAIGMVYPAKQVHGKTVLQGHAKVHVDNVEADFKDYILPVPTEEFSKLGQTKLSFIQWPKKYIELTKASNQTWGKKVVAENTSTQTGTKQIMAANTSTQAATKQISAANKESSTRKQTSPTLSRQEGPSNHIAAAAPTKSATKGARLLNSASKEKEELMKRMNSYRGQIQKRACVRSTYERLMRSPDPTRSMHVDVEPRVFGQSESFQISVSPVDLMLLFTNGCLNSSIITLFATFDGLLVKNYLLQAMDPSQHKLFYLAPYVESKHWNLFIIVPQQNTGFILDSDMEGKNEESYEFTNVVQKALGNMKWNLVEMPWNDKKPFTTKELDDIVSSCISVCGI